ncbi:MAG: WHG domain-containing protein [Ruminococcus sp.]|nr:WHG domain-containing protein [Ruminococcus sp.]
MPPKQKFTKEEIISAALNLVRKEGAEALTARSLGDALQSSARPIFTVFENMAQVRDEVKKAAEEIYNQYIREGLKEKQPFKGTGKAYVRMAREEPNLFRLLFMTGAPQVPKMDDLMRYVDTISTSVTDAAKESFEVDRETAQKLHHHLWIYSHGIAVLQATGVCNFTDEETDKMLTQVGLSLIKYMKE